MDVLTGGALIMGGIPDPLSINRIEAKSGPLKVGSATSGHGLTATSDLLIAGKLEVDDTAYLDGGLTIGADTNSRRLYPYLDESYDLGKSIAHYLSLHVLNIKHATKDISFYPSGMANASEIGQGDTDTDISYIALRNASGTLCYIYPNATGDGIVVSTTKP